VEARGAAVLIVHEEREVIDRLREVLEAQGFAVDDCTSAAPATARLAAGVDAVLISWDGPLGRDVFGWALRHRRELRRRFVALRREIPADKRELALRRRVVACDDVPAILAITTAIVGEPRPRMLLVDDDAAQLGEMAVLLEGCGFDVTTAHGVTAATEHLAHAEVDVILSDWRMSDGAGDDLYRWIATMRPDLAEQIVFITGGSIEEARRRVPGVAVLPKGQDSPSLLRHLDRTIGNPRIARGTPPEGLPISVSATTTMEPSRASMKLPSIPPLPAPPP